jgi:hypothetical protein
MRRLTAALAALVLLLAIAAPVAAHGGGHHGSGHRFVDPNDRVHGHTLRQLATEWLRWGFGTPEADNPLLANRCERSPFDRKIWFMPVSLGDDYAVDCKVPYGSYLVVTPGGFECSEGEGDGGTKEELRACVDAGFAEISLVELSLDGRPAKHLDRYIVTSKRVILPGPNLVSDVASPSMMKGYFLVVKPLKPGAHTLRSYDEFTTPGDTEPNFTAGITINLTVGHPHHYRHH